MKIIITDHLVSMEKGKAIVLREKNGILIDGGKIAGINRIEEYKDIIEDMETEVIDLSGLYVLPGLIDGHLHLSFSASSQPLDELYEDDDETILLRMSEAARTELKAGVTTVRDAGARGMAILKLRDFINKGQMLGPDIITAGMPITITGGHCNFCGLECDSKEEVIKAVRWLCKQNVDFIKVMVSGGNMTPGSDSMIDQYDEDILTAIVKEAHQRGKKVSGHVHSTLGIERAVKAGFDILDHCSFKAIGGEDYRQELVDEMIKRGISVSPAIGKAYILPPEEAAPLPEKVAMWGAFQKSRFQTTNHMYCSGVSIMAGTDAGCKNTKFDEFYLTLNMMHEKIGMTKEDVLLSATFQAAQILGEEKRLGSIEEGKQADIIAVEGNPLEDLLNLNNVKMVFKRGETVCL